MTNTTGNRTEHNRIELLHIEFILFMIYCFTCYSFKIGNSYPIACDSQNVILLRNEIADPCPRGWTALVSRMMYVFVVGSIHSEVPVKPKCPSDRWVKYRPDCDGRDGKSNPKARAFPLRTGWGWENR